LKETIEVQTTTQIVYPKLTRNSMLKDFQNHPKGNAFYPQLLEASGMDIPSESDALSPEEAAEKRKLRMFVMAFLDEMLVKKLPAISEGRFTDVQLDEILQQVQ
jgi:beta-glucosidase